MALDVYQWSYNDLVFGEGTRFIVNTVQGLNPPDAKADIEPKAGGDGSWVWAKYLGERHVIIAGTCVSTGADVWDDLAELEAAFALQETDLPLAFNFPGPGSRHIDCKPVNFAYNADRIAALTGTVDWAVELVAGDPAIVDGES